MTQELQAILDRLEGTSYPKWITEAVKAAMVAPAAPEPVSAAPATRIDNMHFETLAALNAHAAMMQSFGVTAIGLDGPALSAQLDRISQVAIVAGTSMQRARADLIRLRTEKAKAAMAAAVAKALSEEGTGDDAAGD